MNPEIPRTPREELEARLTALLLGELTPEEAEATRRAIAQDANLTQLHAQLQATLALVREAAASEIESAPAQPALKLSKTRREVLMAHFKTPAPTAATAEAPTRPARDLRTFLGKGGVFWKQHEISWFVPVATALIVLLLAVIVMPNFVRARNTAAKNSILNNLRVLDVAKQQWALENKKSDTDVPTLEDIAPYFKGDGAASLTVAGEKYELGRVQDDPVAIAKNGEKVRLPSADEGVFHKASDDREKAKLGLAFKTWGSENSERYPATAPSSGPSPQPVPALTPAAPKPNPSAKRVAPQPTIVLPPASGPVAGFEVADKASFGISDRAAQRPAEIAASSETPATPAVRSYAGRPIAGDWWYAAPESARFGGGNASSDSAAAAERKADEGRTSVEGVATVNRGRMLSTTPASGTESQHLFGTYAAEQPQGAIAGAMEVNADATPMLGDTPAAGVRFSRRTESAGQRANDRKGFSLLGRAESSSEITPNYSLVTTNAASPGLAGDFGYPLRGGSAALAKVAPESTVDFYACGAIKAAPAAGAPAKHYFDKSDRVSDSGRLAEQEKVHSLDTVGYANAGAPVTWDDESRAKRGDLTLYDTDQAGAVKLREQLRQSESATLGRGIVETKEALAGRSPAVVPPPSATQSPGYLDILPSSHSEQRTAVPARPSRGFNANEEAAAKQRTQLVKDGKLLLDLGKPEEARKKLEAALKAEPGNKAAAFYLQLANDDANRRTESPSSAQSDVVKTSSLISQAVETDAPPARKPSTNAPIPQPEVQTSENAFSTFSLNVSDVAFKLAAASLEKGQMPDAASVRAEEFINAFDYRDPEPPPGGPVAFAWERARYPFAHNRDLLRFSLKTAAAGRQAGRPLNLVLLLDNSGSMERADRVRIIREALRVLAGQLQPQDKLSVITFARTARLLADGVSGDKSGEVLDRAGGITPQGGTNLEEAMNLAYATALRHYLTGGINRVVLLTDGAANLGNVEPEPLKQKVEAHRKQGVAFDCFGIGWEGFNDDLLEVLSRNGDGRYGFINSPEETATEFAGQLAGALKVAASDVKVQVEFNPKRVTAYRQIGYAKHQLTKEQFRDNTVDAAEIAAQEAGNALYTVEVNPAGEGPLCIVRCRFKIPGTTDYREHEWAVPYTGNAVSLEQASPAMRLAASASTFAEWLVASPFAAEVTPDALIGYLSGVPETYGADARPKKLEWMIRQAKSLAGN